MVCQHCRQRMKYKERQGRRCGHCQREFVFEPREDALGMSDRRFRTITEHVSDHGKLVYTPEQLVFYVSRRSVPQAIDDLPKILLGIGAFTLVIMIGSATHWAVALALLIALTYVAVRALRKQTAPHPYVLTRRYVTMEAWKQEHFLHNAHNRWANVYGIWPFGLLGPESRNESWAQPPSTIRVALVCPDRAVLRCLYANGVSEHLGLALISTAESLTLGEQATLQVLRQDRTLPLLVLHSASAQGCLLAETVRARLGVNPEHRLIDIGLRPRDAAKYHLMTFPTVLTPGALERLVHDPTRL